MKLYVIVIIIIIIILLFLIIPDGNISIDKLFKMKYLKEKNINIKESFFIIKDEIINSNKTINSKDILLYPGFEKNIIDIGDIILRQEKKYKKLLHKLIKYGTNSDFTHVLMVNEFLINDNNNYNYNVPEGYKLIDPILIHAAFHHLVEKNDDELSNKLALVGKISLYKYQKHLPLNLTLHIFRYKNMNDKLKNDIISYSEYYKYSGYSISAYFNFAFYKLFISISKIFQKLLNLDYYDFMRKVNLFYLKNLSINVNLNIKDDVINIKKIELLNKKIKIYIKKIAIDKKKSKIHKKILNKLLIVKKNLTNKRQFTCASFIHYMYKLNDIELIISNNLGISDIQMSKSYGPSDVSKILYDTRFKYISTFKNY